MTALPKLINQKENAKYLICIISWKGCEKLAMVCLPSVLMSRKNSTHSDVEKTYWDISTGKWNLQARVDLIYDVNRAVFSEQWDSQQLTQLLVGSPSRHK